MDVSDVEQELPLQVSYRDGDEERLVKMCISNLSTGQMLQQRLQYLVWATPEVMALSLPSGARVDPSRTLKAQGLKGGELITVTVDEQKKAESIKAVRESSVPRSPTASTRSQSPRVPSPRAVGQDGIAGDSLAGERQVAANEQCRVHDSVVILNRFSYVVEGDGDTVKVYIDKDHEPAAIAAADRSSKVNVTFARRSFCVVIRGDHQDYVLEKKDLGRHSSTLRDITTECQELLDNECTWKLSPGKKLSLTLKTIVLEEKRAKAKAKRELLIQQGKVKRCEEVPLELDEEDRKILREAGIKKKEEKSSTGSVPDISQWKDPESRQNSMGGYPAENSAVTQSIEKKGSSSYYYAHHKTKDWKGPKTVSGGAPSQLESEGPIGDEGKQRIAIQHYAWADEESCIRITIEGDQDKEPLCVATACAAAKNPALLERLVTLDCRTPYEFRLLVQGTQKDFELHMQRLDGEIDPTRCVVRVEPERSRVIVKLKKKDPLLLWTRLGKQL